MQGKASRGGSYNQRRRATFSERKIFQIKRIFQKDFFILGLSSEADSMHAKDPEEPEMIREVDYQLKVSSRSTQMRCVFHKSDI